MDGIPIFNLVRETMPAVTILGFRGVVNSTTNYILTAMEAGQPFGDALAEMQAAGIAEADASLDVDGWDAAAKTAALANVLLGARLTPQTVDREGITAASGPRAMAARAAGRRLKLVARAERNGSRITARLARRTSADDLLAGVEGQQNAIIFIRISSARSRSSSGGGLTQTAYALLSDLVTIARRAERPRRRPRQPAIAAMSAGSSKPLTTASGVRVAAEHRQRRSCESARDEIVIRTIVLVDVVGRERHPFA
jgi:homoserine dehydrogenase